MKSKYNSHKIRTPYGIFDSQTELDRFFNLMQMQRDGKIRELKRQVEFEVLPRLMRTVTIQLKTKTKTVQRVEERNVKYTPDFTYYEGDVWVIEEVKSDATKKAKDYPLRKKLMKLLIAKHNQESDEKWMFREIIIGEKKERKKK